ncbi:MAG TPA: metallophosphoesterase [Nocardioidaceae bacterium]
MSGRPRRTGTVLLASVALLLTACADGRAPAPGSPEVAGTSADPALGAVTGPLVVAAGDIACRPGAPTTATTCQQAATAGLAEGYAPRRVLTLGDHQYDAGTLADFRASYADSWGRLKSITEPVPGNHEYRTDGASGYYTYFRRRQPGPPGYHAFDVGTWRVYALNTNCTVIDCRAQRRWLERRLTRDPHRCTALTMHHPRFSSGKHGSNGFVRPFWRIAVRHGVDLALAGHDHHYERLRRRDASGAADRRGIISFVSGAGGSSLYDVGRPVAGSVFRDSSAFGVLALRLGKRRFAWEYQTIEGDVLDSGVRRCIQPS